jgi:hypothetical protein
MLVVLKYLLEGTSDDLEIWNTYYQHRVDLMEKLAIPEKPKFYRGDDPVFHSRIKAMLSY